MEKETKEGLKSLAVLGALGAGALLVAGTVIEVVKAAKEYTPPQPEPEPKIPYDPRVFGDCQVEGCGRENVEMCQYKYHNDFNVPHCLEHPRKFTSDMCYACWLWET
jgi:hypothetical protein